MIRDHSNAPPARIEKAHNPIGDLFKTQVWQLARHLDVPVRVIDKPPSADLDEASVPGLGDDVLDSDVLACCHPRVEAEGSQLRVPVHVSLGPHFGLG